MSSSPLTVLVTGASTGLGLALTKQLLPLKEYRLILTARKSSLARFAAEGIVENERVWLRPLDVTLAEERVAIINEAEERWGGVDILVNNAGIAYRAVVEHVTEEDRLRQMDINFRSPMELVRLILPSMRAKRQGRIINVSSAAGMMAMPTMAVYSASKFALEGATEALYYEAKPWGIKVTLLQPGFINSSSFENVRFTDSSCKSLQDGTDAYSSYYNYMGPFIGRIMRWTWATPEKVAAKLVKIMRQKSPPLRVQATPDVRLFAMLRRFLPQRLYHAILYYNLPHIRDWVPRLKK
ncbi:MAG: SDR family NAD(P)-dependent oxidoreductase [Deltaproteobacteria bacterium]|nr:MAG: SDR family NAD(P)-dependent oxidoreductase [Deltaproteobacteria bacterium]